MRSYPATGSAHPDGPTAGQPGNPRATRTPATLPVCPGHPGPVDLPCTYCEADLAVPSRREFAVGTGRHLVLVVEDDDAIRWALGVALEAEGYDVGGTRCPPPLDKVSCLSADRAAGSQARCRRR